MSLATLSASRAGVHAREGVLRHSAWDAFLVGAALVHGAVLVTMPNLWVMAVGLWWNANTVSHNFIHLPFFRHRLLNQLFSTYLSLLLGFPQRVWHERHLAHHAARKPRLRWDAEVVLETIAVGVLWTGLWVSAPQFFLTVYLPGWLLGMGLCYLQGHYEHARGTVSYYGVLYNWLFFNDGLHAEHHARPWLHWRQLTPAAATAVSRWPAVARGLENLGLNGLEKLLFRSALLRRFVLTKHEQALRALLPRLGGCHQILIVGGGLFPRTALLLRKLFPQAELTVVEADPQNIQLARSWVDGEVHFREGYFHPQMPSPGRAPDLIVIPLAFRGDRASLYKQPPAGKVLVHDWYWRKRGVSIPVSIFLLKRLNLLER